MQHFEIIMIHKLFPHISGRITMKSGWDFKLSEFLLLDLFCNTYGTKMVIRSKFGWK